jgi:mRNA interferase YafQ
MLNIEFTNVYQKDVRLVRRRGLPENELNDIIYKLAEGKPLALKHRDHALQGKYSGYRECHIRPDWLLIYKIDKQILTLVLTRTGTHSDLF